MSTDLVKKQSDLPTLAELVSDVDVYEKQDKLNFLLSQEPPQKWIKEHPYVKGHKYIPIDKVEYLLRKIFKEYRIEILREGTSFNGVYVTIRLHYKNFINDEWSSHDGIGAINLQTKKGSSPADLANLNNGALSIAYPLAKTLAVKDAADMFGKLFGADLNRRDTLPASMDKPKLSPDEERIMLLINSAETQEDLDFAREHSEEKHLELIKAKQIEINKKNKK